MKPLYRLLIVDDEIHVVEGLIFDLNGEKLNISEVFTAYTVKMAKEVFEKFPVDILLCDIQMPQGSGLELLAWVKENYPATETILITSHADFHYAKEALELGSLDYLLKPVPVAELEKAIEKAKSKISQTSQFNQYHKLWTQHHPLIVERFWLDLLQHTIPAKDSAIRTIIKERNLPYSERMKFLPVLVSVHRWQKDLNVRDRKILEYALKNSADELIFGDSHSGSIVPLERSRMLLVLVLQPGEDGIPEPLRTSCQAYIESCRRYFYCDISCYIGSAAYAHELPGVYGRLTALERNNVAFDNKVFLLQGDIRTSEPIKLPDMELWAVMLKKGAKDTIVREASDYLERLVKSNCVDAALLQKLYVDFQQMVYSLLNQQGIHAYRLFGDPLSAELSTDATRSVFDLIAWMKHTVYKALEQTEAESVVDKVKKYISHHLDQDELSRDGIAAQTFLNPDYLSRIFKRETGFSISDYVLQERIRIAKELLAKTEMAISQVAESVGYSNFSHFTNIFKKHAGLSPMDYRHRNQDAHASRSGEHTSR
ncbi:helix-turn-helix domain-containing protein [Paenibacillus sp. R14(2021)]|uniref:response regulator transcription factor n=1 Tax=Paenibacillus sp. R14(2021) TaxID=2859228 RepID=UPI0021583A20|nr:helix-turn-helix domain-containing protein [Paenibacillus sp. R14(2021)]